MQKIDSLAELATLSASLPESAPRVETPPPKKTAPASVADLPENYGVVVSHHYSGEQLQYTKISVMVKSRVKTLLLYKPATEIKIGSIVLCTLGMHGERECVSTVKVMKHESFITDVMDWLSEVEKSEDGLKKLYFSTLIQRAMGKVSFQNPRELMNEFEVNYIVHVDFKEGVIYYVENESCI